MDEQGTSEYIQYVISDKKPQLTLFCPRRIISRSLVSCPLPYRLAVGSTTSNTNPKDGHSYSRLAGYHSQKYSIASAEGTNMAIRVEQTTANCVFGQLFSVRTPVGAGD